MSYHHCRNGHHAPECTGYIGPLDGYTCLCSCHGEWNEKGERVPLPSWPAAVLLDPEPAIPRRGHGASEGGPSL